MMALYDLRIVTFEPLPADRKSSVAPSFGNAGFFEQRKGAAARTDENKRCFNFFTLICGSVFYFYRPFPVCVLPELAHFMVEMKVHAAFFFQAFKKATCKRSKVHI